MHFSEVHFDWCWEMDTNYFPCFPISLLIMEKNRKGKQIHHPQYYGSLCIKRKKNVSWIITYNHRRSRERDYFLCFSFIKQTDTFLSCWLHPETVVGQQWVGGCWNGEEVSANTPKWLLVMIRRLFVLRFLFVWLMNELHLFCFASWICLHITPTRNVCGGELNGCNYYSVDQIENLFVWLEWKERSN